MQQLFEFTASISSLMPVMIVGLTALLVMIVIAIKRSHFWSATLSVVGLNAALLTLIAQAFGVFNSNLDTHALFVFDGFALFNTGVVLIAALACCTLCYGYFKTFKDHKDELYLLILISTIGAMLMTAAQHLAAFFMSLELLSVPMYGMLAYSFLRSRSLEAGLKYLILSATASATLLMGMALIYIDIGSLQFKAVAQALFASKASVLTIVGSMMMLAAVAFKLSAAPFHAWVSDVYEGAPAPVAAYLASVSKVAMMALAVRFFIHSAMPIVTVFVAAITLVIAASILLGNLLAVRQTNLKRLLAYSSIAHIGYALIALLAIGSGGVGIISLYMAVYAFTSIGAFGVISLMSSPYRERTYTSVSGEADEMRFYQGLFWRRPILTAVLTVMLLSLAGIPLTAGFIAKFTVFFAAIEGQLFWAAAMVIVGSAIGLYYYLRILLNLYQRPKAHFEFDAHEHWGVKAGGVMLMIVTVFIVFFGIFPESLMKLASFAVIL